MASQNRVTPSAEGLAASARAAAAKGLPPVHEWDPPDCGDIDIRIARDGKWYYLGSPIERVGLVRLFSSILRKDGDRYVLVTPVEKVGITVEDAPFVAIDFSVEGTGETQVIAFETHVGDRTVAGPDAPIRVARDAETGEPAPYVLVRHNLEALIDRKSFYRLIDICVHHDVSGVSWFGLWSLGQFFPVIPSAELP